MRSIAISLALVALLITTGRLDAQSDTLITYQGELIEKGSPANGIFSMEFALFDVPLAGVQAGATEFDNNVSVTNGRFTVELDFGASAFDNSERWLEIAVNGNTLSPRQPINRSPYAIQTRGIFVDNAGNVGIGTTSPQVAVHIAGSTGEGLPPSIVPGTMLLVQQNNIDNWAHMSILSGRFGRAQLNFGDADNDRQGAISYNNVTDALDVQVNATTRMTIDSTGNVGIGTSTPDSPLSVEASPTGSTTVILGHNTADSGGTGVSGISEGTSGVGVLGQANAITGTTFGGQFLSDSMSGRGVSGIASAPTGITYGVQGEADSTSGRGVSGIASASSGITYGVHGESQSASGRGVYGYALSNTGINYGVLGETNSASGYAGAFFGGRNYFEGSVGIGTLAPQSKLHITHDAVGAGWGIRINSAATSNNQGGLRISNEGFLDVTNKANIGAPNFARLNSGGVWTVVSDRRMKEEIAPLTGVLDRAMRLDPVSYWYKNQDRARMPDHQIGFIAQEVEPLFPSLVSHGDDLLTMNYNGLGVVAIAAIQELKHQTDVEMKELRDETDARRDENNELRTRLDALEQQDAERQQQIQDLQRLVEQLNPTLDH